MSLWLVLGSLWALSLIATALVFHALGRRQAVPAPDTVLTPARQEVPVAALVSEEPAPPAVDDRWAKVRGLVAFHQACQERLAQSIIGNLRSTTEPLTQNLAAIRASIFELLSRVRAHDRKMISGEDLAWVESLGGIARQDMAEATRLTHDSHSAFSRHVDSLKRGLETILGISLQIEDLSQKINVLSINASIEAARAGSAGRGFKVIATEVKALALETSSFLGQIAATVTTTQKMFQGIGGDLEAQREALSSLLQRQQSSFSSFETAFTGQREEFEALYRAILAFTELLDGQVSRVSPVVQLHDITVQELENLVLVAQDSLRTLETLAESGEGEPVPGDWIRTWGAQVRTRLTTADELRALDSALKAFGIATKQDAGLKPGALELF